MGRLHQNIRFDSNDRETQKKDAHIYDNKQANSHYTLSLQTKALKSDPCTAHSAQCTCMYHPIQPTKKRDFNLFK